jgi:acetyl-CoA carboxylase biotin carboxyl carrier protein
MCGPVPSESRRADWRLSSEIGAPIRSVSSNVFPIRGGGGLYLAAPAGYRSRRSIAFERSRHGARRQHVSMKKPSVKSAVAPEASGFDLAVVAGLAKIAAANDLSEVEVEREGMRIRVARQRETVTATHVLAAPPVAVAAAPVVAAAPNLLAAETDAGAVENPGTVKSPMVGTAYLRPTPDAKPFVEVGATVKAGDKLMLVEAMKTFNEIVAHRAGKVTQIMIEDGAPVEYGQALMVIE